MNKMHIFKSAHDTIAVLCGRPLPVSFYLDKNSREWKIWLETQALLDSTVGEL